MLHNQQKFLLNHLLKIRKITWKYSWLRRESSSLVPSQLYLYQYHEEVLKRWVKAVLQYNATAAESPSIEPLFPCISPKHSVLSILAHSYHCIINTCPHEDKNFNYISNSFGFSKWFVMCISFFIHCIKNSSLHRFKPSLTSGSARS